MEDELLRTLQSVRGYVFVIMCAVVVWAVFKTIESIQRIVIEFKKAMDSAFDNKVDELIDKGRYKEAIQECEEKLEKYPKNPEVVWQLARACYLNEDHEKAKKYFEEAVALVPSWEGNAAPYLKKIAALH